MCGHYLIDPVACIPTAGWEKGQVENQVGLVRERFFTPRLWVRSYEELNARLLDRAIDYARAHVIPSSGAHRVRGVRGGAAEPRPISCKGLSDRSRTPGLHRIAPVHPGEQVTHLRRHDRDDAGGWRRPQKPPPRSCRRT
jgi:hypothetical protein